MQQDSLEQRHNFQVVKHGNENINFYVKYG